MKNGATEEDEEACFAVDRDLNFTLGATNICVLLLITLFGFFILGMPTVSREQALGAIGYIIFFLFASFSMVFFQTRIVKKIKQYAPEKRGNALDFKFEKEWLDSSDEAEKFLIFSAGYQTFQTMQKTYGAVMIVVMMLGFAVDIGVLPVLIVGLLWTLQTGIYLYKSIRLSRKKLS